MQAFKAIALFELKYHLRQPLFYILLLVYFLITFGAVTTEGITLGGSVGNVNRNAPYVIMMFLLVMSIFGILTTTAFVANSVHRDFELGTDALFFSSPIRKWQFLTGRFFGSFTVAVMVYLGVVGAIMIGSKMWWIDKERLGPFEIFPYAYSLFVMVLPNLLLAGAVFFAIAALTRSLMATYAGAVAFLVAMGIAGEMLEDVENEVIAGLLDPFGFGAFAVATRYWTVFQRNTQVVPLEGIYLWNRLLWVGVSLAIFAFACWRFKFATGTRKARKRARKGARVENELEPIQRITLALPKPSQTFGGMAAFRQFLASVKLETSTIFKSIPFAIILMLGVLNIWGNSTAMDSIFGTDFYPVTGLMVEMINGAFSLFALLIAAFYAGDIVWRERNLKLHEVSDAMPLPTWAQWAAKLTGLMLVILATMVAAVATSILIQAGHRYYNFELGVYAKGIFMEFGFFLLLIAAFAFIVQVVFNQKFVGFLAVLVFFVLNRALPALDFEHRLYRFASLPPATYSDMNGWGHFVQPRLLFSLYWTLLVVALFAVCHLLWVRGTESGLRQRLSIAKNRFTRPVVASLALALIAFAGTGCYIYYNTNVLNEYRTSKEVEKVQAETEKKYKKFESLTQPKVTDVVAHVDIHPERRAVTIRGEYTLKNKTAETIRELHVTHNPQTLQTLKLDIPGARLKMDDREHGYAIYTLERPLAPGATMAMKFTGGFAARGFVNGESNTNVVANGTFINSMAYFPHLGYNSGVELQDRNDRRKHGLGPVERMKKPDDMKARMSNGLSDSDWLNLDTTVSTSPDQIAIAPGYLQREWTANGRRYFHYKTTSPILGFWSYLSARYTVKRDFWTSPAGEKIPIEIYYDAKHPYNVDRMIDATKKSLDYFTTNFSPYQHKQVRILEFPRYARFAQSFPNTIPYSESIGFIADLRDKENIDYVFYVTAHEVAHQWWAHQVIGGNVQGSTMIVETLAQYSALMVMEKEYGREKMQKFLRYELDRYLSGRGGELVAEMPLMLVENQQYIHYRKGSLVMYALRDYIGEAAVNRALAKFIRDHAFDEPPYTTATELVQYFRAEAPPEYQETITDLFARIVLYDLETKEVSSTRRADGKYVVKIKVKTGKLRADAQGEEKPVPINDLIDVGVLGEKDEVIFVEKRRITKPEETFEVVVARQPKKAGIDPMNKLIDRNPKDNVKSL
ncbi:MAG TPA: M1 family aminopeptidase [Thermoanaerobaculia bacterium]|nr:M1 family aminopeptidase [Thermoanaerobaculia bacterium]